MSGDEVLAGEETAIGVGEEAAAGAGEETAAGTGEEAATGAGEEAATEAGEEASTGIADFGADFETAADVPRRAGSGGGVWSKFCCFRRMSRSDRWMIIPTRGIILLCFDGTAVIVVVDVEAGMIVVGESVSGAAGSLRISAVSV